MPFFVFGMSSTCLYLLSPSPSPSPSLSPSSLPPVHLPLSFSLEWE